MAMTQSQLQTLKADIAKDAALSSQPNNDDGDAAIAAAYNLSATPSYSVFKSNVPIVQVGQSFDASELSGLTSLNNTRLQTLAIYLSTGVNPSLASVRQFFDDIFSGAGGQNTRANLLNLWRRFATRVEVLYATGTGTQATPSLLGWEGPLTYIDVGQARSLP